MSEHAHSEISPIRAGVLGKCPRCGKGSMFAGLLKLAPKCSVCGLDFSFADAGDAPAIIVMTIAGFVVLGVVLWIDFVYEPAYWVLAAVSIPFAAALCVLLLRPTKGLMIALQYFNKAEEGRPDQ